MGNKQSNQERKKPSRVKNHRTAGPAFSRRGLSESELINKISRGKRPTTDELLQMQSLIGNRATTSIISSQQSNSIQRKGSAYRPPPARRGRRRGRDRSGGIFRPPPVRRKPIPRREPAPEDLPGGWRWVRTQRRKREREIRESKQYLQEWADGKHPTKASLVLQIVSEVIGFGNNIDKFEKTLEKRMKELLPKVAKDPKITRRLRDLEAKANEAMRLAKPWIIQLVTINKDISQDRWRSSDGKLFTNIYQAIFAAAYHLMQWNVELLGLEASLERPGKLPSIKQG